MHKKSKNQIEVSLEKEIVQDFEKIKQVPEAKRMDAVFKLIKNILKAAIGKVHEYTIEESLFILKEEFNIPTEPYNKLKQVLINFSYYKYGDVPNKMSNSILDKFEKDIISILPVVFSKENQVTGFKIYNEEKNAVHNSPEDNHIHMELLQHKKDILLAEQEIIKSIKGEERNGLPKEVAKPKEEEIQKGEEKLEEEFKFEEPIPPEPEPIKETPENPVDELLDKAPEFIPKLDIPDNDFSDLEKIKLSFNDLFESTTEFPLREVLDYEFKPSKIKEIGWDLHIKYHLLKGKTPAIIKTHFINKIEEPMLTELIEKNSNYLEKNNKYIMLRRIQEITLALTISLLIGKNLEKESKILKKKGFSKKEIDFVLENLLKSF